MRWFNLHVGLFALNRLRPEAIWVLLMLLCLPATAAQAVLEPGETAPAFVGVDADGREVRFDPELTSSTTLMVFVKTRDDYTSVALAATQRLLERDPRLGRALQRVMVVSRINGNEADKARIAAWRRAYPDWELLLDPRDEAYLGYKIIATPTVVIVDGHQKVAAVNPGYDPGMQNRVRRALAELQGVELAPPPRGRPSEMEMRLKIGRMLLQRGVHERALEHYLAVDAAQQLDAAGQMELAQIYMELGEPSHVIVVLDGMTATQDLESSVTTLRERALEAIRRAEQTTPTGNSESR